MNTPTINSRSQSSSSPIIQSDWLPLIAVMGIATILRFYQLGTESLWIDEMLSIRDAETFTWADPGVRPLYYFLLQQWMKIGSGDVWLRSLALIFDVASVGLTFWLGRYAVNRTVGTIAALMFAFSPMLVNHAQEIRMYSPAVFFCLVGTLALAYALDKIHPGLIVIWIGARLLAIMTFPLNLMILGADALLLVWRFRDRRRLLIGFAIALGAMGLMLIPFIPKVINASNKFSAGWSASLESPGFFNIVTKLVDFSTLWPSYILSQDGLLLKAGYALYSLGLVALVGVALWDRKRATEKLYWIAVWAIVPLLPILLKSWVSSSLWVARYLLFTAPYFFILMAQGLVSLFSRQKWLGLAVAILYGAAVTGGLGFYYQQTYRDNWKAAATIIEQNAQPGDIIGQVADIPRANMGFERYYTGNLPTYFVADLLDPDNDLKPDYENLSELSPKDVEAILADYDWPDQAESRLWIVCRDCGNEAVAEQVDRVVDAVMEAPYTIEMEERVFNGIAFPMTLDVMLVTREGS